MSSQPTQPFLTLPAPARVEAVIKVLGTEEAARLLHISRPTLKKFRDQDPERPVEEGVLALIDKHLPEAEATARASLERQRQELDATAAALGTGPDAKAPAA